jgi:hypothetical protein
MLALAALSLASMAIFVWLIKRRPLADGSKWDTAILLCLLMNAASVITLCLLRILSREELNAAIISRISITMICIVNGLLLILFSIGLMRFPFPAG